MTSTVNHVFVYIHVTMKKTNCYKPCGWILVIVVAFASSASLLKPLNDVHPEALHGQWDVVDDNLQWKPIQQVEEVKHN